MMVKPVLVEAAASLAQIEVVPCDKGLDSDGINATFPEVHDECR